MARPPARCARCGETAKGYATINDERYCHDDSRPSCYSQASYEMSFAHIVAENAVRWKDALELLGRDWGPEHG